jgi:transposase
MILKENKTSQTSSDSDNTKTKPALLDKYDEIDQKEIDGYERLKTKESDKLPKPTGWRLVVLPFKMKEKTKGGLYLRSRNFRTSTNWINLWTCS